MKKINILYWQEEDGWLGYLQEYPNYWTQGDTLEDLKEHLMDLYKDVDRLAALLAEYEQKDGPIDPRIMEEVRQEWPIPGEKNVKRRSA